MAGKRKRKPKKKVLSKAEKLQLKIQKKLHKDIMSAFKAAGFEYLRTDGVHKEFGGHKSDIDSAYLFENVILLCEQTISKNDKDHIRKKDNYFEGILENKTELLNWLKKLHPDKFSKFDSYSVARYKIFYLYFSEENIEEDTKAEFPSIKFINGKNLKYFKRVCSCLRFTARNELYKFLGLDLKDVGHPNSGTVGGNIDSAVVIPDSSAGMPSGVQLVSFVMKAKDLMDCAYVLRRGNWEDDIYLYQRLIEQKRIDSIREFLVTKQRTFIDNIIVTLPSKVKFSITTEKGKEKEIDIHQDIDSFTNIKMDLPKRINSIGIIDGQHRIFGHYEGNDVHEPIIKNLREKRHLLVTGIHYHKSFKMEERKKFESELFLQINSKQKKVDKSLLQYIHSLQDPFSPVGIATRVLDNLNKRNPFLNLFILSQLDSSGIKTPTILQFGLEDLVEIDNDKSTLFKYWKGKYKTILVKGEEEGYEEAFDAYIKFCATSISTFFGAVKANFADDWNLNKDSRLLSVTSIIGFIKGFKASLEIYKGVQDFAFYSEKLKKLKISFKKGQFQYKSSHWPTFAAQITRECWK